MSYLKCLISSSLLLSMQSLQAAALEQSGQNIGFFFEPQNYAEISHAIVIADVQGYIQKNQFMQQFAMEDFSTGDLIENEHMTSAALKLQLDPKISLGLSYDQPFAVDTSYEYQSNIQTPYAYHESADIKFKSQNITALLGYQPNQNWNIYAGLAHQQFSGHLALQGENYSILNGYHAKFESDAAWGWLTGINYQIPEYAMRASITYRSAIQHKNKTIESFNTGLVKQPFSQIQTPQSVNIDLQTGITSKNVIYGSLRWINWQNFRIQPPEFNSLIQLIALIPEYSDISGTQMIEYDKDQWSGKLGLAHQWQDNWLNALEVIWDSGVDNPASTLNPSDGYWGIGLANLYKVNQKIDITGAVYYLDFNKPKPNSNDSSFQNFSSLSSVENNTAWLLALRLGYHF